MPAGGHWTSSAWWNHLLKPCRGQCSWPRAGCCPAGSIECSSETRAAAQLCCWCLLKLQRGRLGGGQRKPELSKSCLMSKQLPRRPDSEPCFLVWQCQLNGTASPCSFAAPRALSKRNVEEVPGSLPSALRGLRAEFGLCKTDARKAARGRRKLCSACFP